ncbi:type II toxin-antitoxin system RelE/ParE family toxin [Actinobacillus vicugnae]|uniref:type II toxin-antitoxin system RelE/ParE family toxin n=1 Tax=Actinobacillus vicugnae TaxID=2573093 RepID=UPI001FCBFCF0|nr:type II toxin-antitoxin system RelE/ParE family toxin [Actinobacillus vicugnae]
MIQDIHGLRKIRVAVQQKGKRAGARVIYYYYANGAQIWLFTGYDKSEKVDLSVEE